MNNIPAYTDYEHLARCASELAVRRPEPITVRVPSETVAIIRRMEEAEANDCNTKPADWCEGRVPSMEFDDEEQRWCENPFTKAETWLAIFIVFTFSFACLFYFFCRVNNP